jgi:glycosyltransferase involved in cell wall biosynthesis
VHRFSVDAHAIGRNLTGNEVYVRNLVNGFAALDTESEFIAYVSEPGAEKALPERFYWRRVSGNPFVRLGFDLSRRLRIDRPDLIHVQYTAPLACPVPVVVSIHDVSFLEHPEYFPPERVKQLRITVKRTIERAARVLTLSSFSARAIEQAYGISPDLIRIVPGAVDSIFRPLSRELAQFNVRSQFGVDGPYIFTVGDLQPRKNQLGLIHAFEELLGNHPQLPHHLVLAGKDSWNAVRIRTAAARSAVSDRIHFTGFVTDDELVQLYSGCDVFAFPSFYEGFGLPILEAMACGRAVACSATTATVEVADGAGICFNPHSTYEITRALRDLLVDSELRIRMERLGLQRASQFQWKDTAARTLAVYYEVAEARAREPRAAGAPVSTRR